VSWEEALRSLRQFDERAEKIEQRSLLSQPEFVRLFTEEHACQAPTSPVDEDAQRQLAFLIFRIFDADGDG
jgi:flagellar hook assembly protein FlgD